MKKRRGMFARVAFKLAFGGLFLRPARLLLTVLLAAVSFTLAGLAATAAFYDEERAAVQTYVQFTAAFRLFGAEEELSEEAFGDAKENFRLPYAVAGMYGGFSVRRAALGEEGSASDWMKNVDAYAGREFVHTESEVSVVAYFSEEAASAAGIEFLCGTLPKGENEVAIPSCLMHTFLGGGLGGERVGSAEEILGKALPAEIGGEGRMLTVSGIYQNADCLATDSGSPDCIARSGYAGALFVTEEEYAEMSEGTALAWFAGDGSAASGERVFRYLSEHADTVTSDAFNALTQYEKDVESIARWLSIAGGLVAAFSVLLLYQFVCISLDRRKREIGVLRALGGRGKDVVAIFMLENFLLGVLIGGVAAILTAALLPVMNLAFSALFSVRFALFTYVGGVFPVLFFTAIAVACLSALFPVLRESRRAPIEAIKFNEI